MTDETDDIARSEKRELAILLRMQEKSGKITLSDLRKQLMNGSVRNSEGQMVPNICYSRNKPEGVMARLVEAEVVKSSVIPGAGGSYSLLPASEQELFRLKAKYPEVVEEREAELKAKQKKANPDAPKPKKTRKDEQSAQLKEARDEGNDDKFRAALGPYAQQLFDQERAKQREQEQNPEDKGRW